MTLHASGLVCLQLLVAMVSVPRVITLHLCSVKVDSSPLGKFRTDLMSSLTHFIEYCFLHFNVQTQTT